uniref:Cytochrome b6-f complex subunit 8 n=1 Tax=Cyanidiococcus yangmingshanensis TaxID=2690220 RepID=A0A7G5VUJ7_9RHOD|nr:cytochrome b6-f complex subunit VIII [Cyanidiococcus yangmingshanensis]QMX77364.1 cytochrome b6-f complex subunit VIII [Cyanidiococcus yangmingshanensis]UNJ15781.1 cytochrome b6/f complex subunit VIII [Cyanidioschyzonaceae sp. 2]UNJ15979.1 cytochrome b6/f complex subunit VIII [Cyanidioschyzonaceae sp. 3]
MWELDLIHITWGCIMATFSASLALVIWARNGL